MIFPLRGIPSAKIIFSPRPAAVNAGSFTHFSAKRHDRGNPQPFFPAALRERKNESKDRKFRTGFRKRRKWRKKGGKVMQTATFPPLHSKDTTSGAVFQIRIYTF